MKKQYVENCVGNRRSLRMLLAGMVGSLMMLGTAHAAAPVFTVFPSNQTINEDGSTSPLNFSVSTNGVSIVALSSNSALVPVGNVTFPDSSGKDRTVQVTPALNQSGSTTISLVVSKSGAASTNSFTVTVTPMNDPPTVSAIANKTINEDASSGSISFTVGDIDNSASSLTVTATSSNTNLVVSPGTISGGSSRSFTLTPIANENGSSTITVTVRDPGGLEASATFTLTVTPQNDRPTLSGLANWTLDDTNTAVKVFSAVTVQDVDQGRPVDEIDILSLDFTQTATIGTVIASNGSPVTISGPYSITGTPTVITTRLHAMEFAPNANALPVGQSNSVPVSFSLTDGEAAAVAGQVTVSIRSINDLPVLRVITSPGLTQDSQPISPFAVNITDPDLGESFTVSMVSSNDPGGIFGTFSPSPFAVTGNVSTIDAAVRGIAYTPTPNIVTNSRTALFAFHITDAHHGSATTAASLTVTEVGDAPVISGVSGSQMFMDDNQTNTPFGAVNITDPDRNGNDQLALTLSVSAPAYGVLIPAAASNMTPAQATAWVKTVKFIPAGNLLAVGQAHTVNLKISVTDASGITRFDDQTRVSITGVDGAPTFAGLPLNGAIKAVKPADPRPFDAIHVVDDDTSSNVVLNITIDNTLKGSLSISNAPLLSSGGTYSFTNSVSGISNLLNTIHYDLNTNYPFAATAPGDTTFTLQAIDSLGNRAEETLRVQFQNNRKNHLVTRTQDDSAPGSLRSALSSAAAGDFITFALPSYPALIRLNPANGPIAVTKHAVIQGPGADLLRISGDSDGNGTPDMQLFSVSASLSMSGLTLESGSAQFGGAVSVKPNGELSLYNCVVKNSVAQLWGGAIDVENGSLLLDGCLILNNATDAAFGLGGGGVSVYSDQSVRFVNSTFSGNRQMASSGLGGGAVFIENSDPQTILLSEVVHCTFAENRDFSAAGVSAISVNSQGAVLRPHNAIFADASGRNLSISGGGTVESQGGNLADDSTFVLNTQSGQANSIYLLDQISDWTSCTTIGLENLQQLEGPTAVYPLGSGSSAISAAQGQAVAVDQRGIIRDATPDSGAFERDRQQRILINEIQAQGATGDFIELYVPRNASPVDLTGYRLLAEGKLIHTFGSNVIGTGYGIVVANTGLSGATGTVVTAAAPFDLPLQGGIELQDLQSNVVAVAAYVDDYPGLTGQDLSAMSLTLAPQFSGSAFLPHEWVQAPMFGGWDTSVSNGKKSSPGSDTANTPFGATNAAPVAQPDQALIGEDRLTFIDVLANDSDADGGDVLVVSGVPDQMNGTTSLSAAFAVSVDTNTLLGNGIWYDPRGVPAIQQLPAGGTLSDQLVYQIKDYGTNAVVLSPLVVSTPPASSGLSPKGGWSTNRVDISIVGANDYPKAGPDGFDGNEEGILRLMADPDLAGSTNRFDSDSLYPVRPLIAAGNLLQNDTDVDTDDDATTLKVVGVLDQVYSLQSVSSSGDGLSVVVESQAHGLNSGEQIVVSGYPGYPAYNGSHAVTVLDPDHFSIPVSFVDAAATTNTVWGRLDDSSRLTAQSRLGAEVNLEIRADRAETGIIYNPLSSAELNALADGETATDRFYYAVSDRHGAISLGSVDIHVAGVNDVPLAQPDPDPLTVLNPFIGQGTLEDVLSGLNVLDRSGTGTRTDVRVQIDGLTEADSVVLPNLWMTLETEPLVISAADILSNDSDVDSTDVLQIYAVSNSTLGVALSLSNSASSVVYDAPSSPVLDALAHNEMVLDHFQVVITDGHGAFVTNSVALLVVGVNDSPVAYNDSVTTKEDQNFNILPITYAPTNSLGKDYDVDINGTRPDDTLWIIDTNGVSGLGADFVLTNNLFTYDPAVSIYLDGLPYGTSVVDTVQYTLTDQSFVFADDDLFRVAADGSGFNLDVLANDRNFNARLSPLNVVELGIPDQGGSVTTNAAASGLVYTPAINFIGDEIFTYGIEDAYGNFSRGRVVVRVTSETFNGHLQANADAFTVARGESVLLPVLANDNTLPASGSALQLTGLSNTNGVGTVSIEGNAIRFSSMGSTNTASYQTTFRYEVAGNGTARASALVSVQVLDRTKTLPTADDFFHVDSDSLNNVLDVIANDTLLPDHSTLTIVEINSPPAHGTVSIDAANNQLIYNPNAGYVGVDHISYKAVDYLGGTGFGEVSVSVGVPRVANDAYVVLPNSTNTLPVLANDRLLPMQPMSLEITQVSPTNSTIGSVSTMSGNKALRFIAGSGTNGTSTTFTYTVADGSGGRSVAGTVTVTLGTAGVFANADAFYVPTDAAAIELNVLSNDRTLPDLGRGLSVLSVGTGADAPNQGGTVVISPDNSRLLYTPATGFSGEETFTYTVTDAFGTDAARVTVQVGAPAIGASDDAFKVYHDQLSTPSFTLEVLNNDLLLPVGSGLLHITGVGINDANGTNAPTEKGLVNISTDGRSLLYTPDTNYTGASYSETFTYEVSDGSVARSSAKVTVDVQVRKDAYDLVKEINDDVFSVERNSSGNALKLLQNDGALPGSAAQWGISSVTDPEYGGRLLLVNDTVVYTPAPDFTGTDSFEYSITDGHGGSATASVRVKVGDIMLNEDRYTVVSGSVSNALQVLVNDGVQPGPDYPLSIHSSGASMRGATITNGSTQVYYSPVAAPSVAYPYEDRFEYTVLDDSGIAVTQTVAVTVVKQGDDRSQADVQVTVEGVNDLPRMFGFSDLLETRDNAPIKPYRVAQLTDVDLWGEEVLTVSVQIDDAAKGRLVTLGGFVDEGGGSYTTTGTPAAVTASLRGLFYEPVENRIPVGTNEVVTLDIEVQDPFMATPLTDRLNILVWGDNDSPVISGVTNSLSTSSADSVRIFPTAVVTDVDDGGQQVLSVEVVLDNQDKGDLNQLNGFALKTPGHWARSGTPAEITAALQSLLFVPAAGRLADGVSEVAHFEVQVTDSFIALPVSDTVMVTVTGANSVQAQWRVAHFSGNTAMAGDDQDPDGDKLSNIAEYVFGTDPMVPNSTAAHKVVQTVDEANSTLTLSYNRRKNDPSLTYIIQKSLDLTTWIDASLSIISESSVPVDSEMDRVTVTFQLSGESGFHRVIVIH